MLKRLCLCTSLLLPMSGCEMMSDPSFLSAIAAGLQGVENAHTDSPSFYPRHTFPSTSYSSPSTSSPPRTTTKAHQVSSKPASKKPTNTQNQTRLSSVQPVARDSDNLPSAIVITIKNTETGKWSGAGPLQRAWSSEDTEQAVISKVTPSRESGTPRLLHEVGRSVPRNSGAGSQDKVFRIYSLDRPLKRGEIDLRTARDYTSLKLPIPSD